MWRRYWGQAAYSDRYCQHVLDLQTRRRKAFLLLLYRSACKAVDAEEIHPGDEAKLRLRLATRRSRMEPYMACVAMAIDAALARLWLKNNPRKMKLMVCYSAFGNIRQISRTYARELRHVFRGVFDELHVFGCAGLKEPMENTPVVTSIKIHLRNITFNELVAFAGIKAPGLNWSVRRCCARRSRCSDYFGR